MPSLPINDIRLTYQDQGSGIPVVLLHGLGSCKEDWQVQIDHLAQDYRVIALDLRGHGESDKPRHGYTICQFAADVLGLLDALACQHVHLIGFSLGGMIAQEFAAHYPQRLHSVVVINATPSVVLDNWPLRKMFWGRLLTIQLRGVGYMAKLIAERNFPASEQATLRAQVEAQFARNDKAAYFRSTRSIMNWDIRPQLPQISCPLLAISSDNDYTPVSAKQALVDAVPDGRLQVIAPARHLLPMEQPQALNDALDAWLNCHKSA